MEDGAGKIVDQLAGPYQVLPCPALHCTAPRAGGQPGDGGLPGGGGEPRPRRHLVAGRPHVGLILPSGLQFVLYPCSTVYLTVTERVADQ